MRSGCLEKLRFHKLSAKAWELIGASPFHSPVVTPVPRRTTGAFSVDEIFHHAVCCNEELKIPQTLPSHFHSAASQAQAHINQTIQQLTRSIERAGISPQPHKTRSPPQCSELNSKFTTPVRKNPPEELDFIDPDFGSDDGPPSPEVLSKLQQISDSIDDFKNGSRAHHVPLGQQSVMIHRIFAKPR